MTDSAASPPPRRLGVRVVLTVVSCLLLAGAAAAIHFLILSTEPTAQREGATRTSAALVETVVVGRGSHQPQLTVLGVVEPAREIVLEPRVGGEIVEMEPALVPGGIVAAGDPLLRIDPVDFERALTMRRTEVREIEAELAIEEGRQRIAVAEFELLGQEIDGGSRALVLREPQIAAIRARLDAARAAVEQAEIDLERTRVAAPFDAKILERMVDLGSQIAPNEPIARLVGTDEYWIMASVPLRDLRRIAFPDADAPGSDVVIRHATAWGDDATRHGTVSRLIGAVDMETRLARVLVSVPDPLARASDDPPLILGTIVELRIACLPLDDVVRLDRAHLRRNGTVWVMEDDVLRVRPVEVAFSDADFAYVSSGLASGDHVVTTSLATVSDGLPLRREGDAATGDAESIARGDVSATVSDGPTGTP